MTTASASSAAVRASATGSPGAVLLSNAVGDSVMMMALVHNLCRNSHAPRVIGRIGEQLASWFPHCDIGPALVGGASRYEVVVELYPTRAGAALARGGSSLGLSELPGFRQPGASMLDNILRTGSAHFGLRDVVRDTGVVLPPHLSHRRFPDRVVIHPTASHPEKTWSRQKFAALARALRARGLAPSFIVTPQEFDAWRSEERDGVTVHAYPSLAGVAEWVAEAGWFIGNDSGPGHLASALGIPTLSLFMRRGLAQTWRPGWAPGRVVLPPGLLPGACLRERFWQQALSVGRVLRAFDALQVSPHFGVAA